MDEGRQEEAAEALLGPEQDVKDHVEEAGQGALALLTHRGITPGPIRHVEHWKEIDDGNYNSEYAELHVVRLIKDLEFARR